MGLFNAHNSPQSDEPDPGPVPLARYYAGPETQPFILEPGEGQSREQVQAAWASDPRRPVDLADPPKEPRLQVARHAELMRLRGTTRDGVQHGGGRRGQVRGMSRQARRRLMELFASIDRRLALNFWLFVTLTYPGEYSGDWAVWKRDLDSFFKRLLRYAPECAAIWRLEFQRRGAPHYHLLLCGRAFLDRAWVAHAWYEIVGSGDARHLWAGTQVKGLTNWRQTTKYVSSYIGKPDTPDQVEHTGRVWGVHNRAALPVEVLDLPLLWAEFHTLRRLMRRLTATSKSWPPGRGPPTLAPGYTLRSRSRAAGARLFVAEAVCYRLLRGVPTLNDMGQDPPEIGTNRPTFGNWIRDPAKGGRPVYGPHRGPQGKSTY